MSTHRNPIGFKVTDNKIAVFEPLEDQKGQLNESDIQKVKAVFELAQFIIERMNSLATSIVRNNKFSDHNAERINEKCDKVYIKYFEPN